MNRTVRGSQACALCAGALLLPLSLSAQLPMARLDTLFPPGARVGSTVDVNAAGADLDDARSLEFSLPGIQAKQVGGPGSARFAVTVGTNVPVGNYEVRILGRFGVSNPRRFAVGDLPEVHDVATNSTPGAALPVGLGTTINGQVTAARSDYFRIPLKAGQRVLVECAAAELDSKLDPVLLLYSADGKELGRNRRRGLLDWTASNSGDYVVRLQDLLNRGGAEYFYRLSISDRPYLDAVYPLSVEPGTNRWITLIGRNLPGGKPLPERKVDGRPLEVLEVLVNPDAPEWSTLNLATSLRIGPAGAGLDGFDFRLPSSNGISNPLFLSRAAFPVKLEAEPNNLPAKSQLIVPPVELSGEFSPRNDADWFSFQAKKGETWVVEVISQRQGSPTDPAIHLSRVTTNKKGAEELAEVAEAYDFDPGFGVVDFKPQSGDPSLRVDIKEDGLYRLLVRDQARVTRDDIFRPYRLVIRPLRPDFRLVALPQAPAPANKDSKEVKTWSPLLRRGGTLPVRVMAFRRDGLDQDIQLSVEGLPPGVTCPGARLVGADGKSTTLFIKAEDSVSTWEGPVKIVGRATPKQGELVREARAATLVWGVGSYETEAVQSRVAGQFTLAVSGDEAAPLSLALGEGKPLEAPVNGKVSLPAKLVRRAEFPGNTKVKLLGHSVLGGGKEIEVDKAATNAVFELDLAQLKFPEGEHQLYLETQTAFKMERSVEAGKKAEAQKAAAEKGLTQAREASDKAKAVLTEATKVLEKAQADAKADPAKSEAAKTLASAKEIAAKAAESAAQRVKEAEQAKTAAEERVKQYAKRDYTDTFYSTPLTVRITSPKTAQVQPPKP